MTDGEILFATGDLRHFQMIFVERRASESATIVVASPASGRTSRGE
jgi:hypothetical protein